MKSKLSIILMLALLAIFMIPTGIFAQSELKVKLNGEGVSFDTAPLVENGSILSPLEGVFEKMGAEVKWDKDKNKVFIEDKYTTLEFSIGDDVAYVHKKYDFTGIPLKAKIDAAPKIINNSVFVPLQFTVESLGAKFYWDKENDTAIIETKESIVTPDTTLPYDVITTEDIKNNTDLLKWYEDNYKNRGIHYKQVGDSVYVLVCAGEKSTGGYSITIRDVILKDRDKVSICAILKGPGKDEFTTQVITYPNVLLKINSPNIKHVGGAIINKYYNYKK